MGKKRICSDRPPKLCRPLCLSVCLSVSVCVCVCVCVSECVCSGPITMITALAGGRLSLRAPRPKDCRVVVRQNPATTTTTTATTTTTTTAAAAAAGWLSLSLSMPLITSVSCFLFIGFCFLLRRRNPIELGLIVLFLKKKKNNDHFAWFRKSFLLRMVVFIEWDEHFWRTRFPSK